MPNGVHATRDAPACFWVVAPGRGEGMVPSQRFFRVAPRPAGTARCAGACGQNVHDIAPRLFVLAADAAACVSVRFPLLCCWSCLLFLFCWSCILFAAAALAVLLLLLFFFCNVVSVGGVVGVVVCLWCRFVGRVCCLLLLRAFCFAGLVCCLLLLLLLFFGNVGNVVGVGGVVVSVVVCLWCRTKIRIRTGLSGRLFFLLLRVRPFVEQGCRWGAILILIFDPPLSLAPAGVAWCVGFASTSPLDADFPQRRSRPA